MPRPFKILAGLLAISQLIGIAATPANAHQSKTIKTLTKQLEKDRSAYNQREARARVIFAGYFDRMANLVRQSPELAPELKASKLRTIAGEKAAYISRGEFPRSPEMVEALFVYQDSLQQVRTPLSRTYQKLMNQAIQEHDDELLQKLTSEKATFDEALPGRDDFKASAKWRGSRSGTGTSVRTRLVLGKYEGNAFRGRIFQGDAPYEDEWIVEGTLDGNFISIHTVQIVRGKNRNLRYQGYLLGDRIILKVGGTGIKGEPASGFVEMSR